MAGKKSYQELKRENKQLKKQNDKLVSILKERRKELSCIYKISKLFEEDEQLADILQGTTRILSESWQYPDITCVKIKLNGEEFKTPNYKKTHWRQRSNLIIKGAKAGYIEVGYLDKKPDQDEGPFLKEERNLLETVTEILESIITRQQATQSLKLNKERLQLALYAAQLGLWDWDIKTDNVHFNEKWAEMLGYNLNEIKHELDTWKKLTHPEDLKIAQNRLEEHFKGQTDYYECEMRIRHKSGKWVWIKDIGKVIEKDHSGNPLRACGIHLDITGLKKKEKELQEKTESLRTTLNSIGDAVISTDLDGNVVRMNPIAEKLTGWDKNKALGKPTNEVFNIINAKTRKSIDNPVDKVFKEGKIVGLANHTVLISKDGREYQIADSAAPIRDESGKIKGAVLVFRDVTGKYRKEKELRESQYKLKTLMSNLPGMAYKCKNVNCRTMEFISEGCLDLTGYSPEEIIKNKVCAYNDIIHPDDRQRVREKIKESIQRGKHFEVEYRIITKNNKLKWVWEKGKSSNHNKSASSTIEGFISDITERKKVQEKLRIREDRLSKIMLAANDGMWDWNLKSNSVFFDPRYYEMAGYEVDEFPHKFEEFQKRVHPDDIKYVIAQVEKHLKGKINRFNVEFRFKRKNGKWMWILGKGIIVERDEHGKPLRFVGTHTDITERKQFEQKLKMSKLRYERLFETTGTATIVYDKDKTVRMCNKKFAELYGISRSEIIDKIKWPEFVHEDDLPRMLNYHKNRPSGEPPSSYEFKFINAEGETRFVFHTVSYLRESQNRIASFLDITDRKNTEKALSKSEEKFKSVFTAASDGIIIVNTKLKVLDVNTAFSDITGIPRDYVIGKSGFKLAKEFVSVKQLPDVLKLLKSLIQKKPTPYFELKYNNKILSLGSSISKETGYLIGVIKDVTEKVKAEKEKEKLQKQLLQAQKLESIGTLAGGVAHDFNNILTVIMGLSELLLNQTDEDNPEYTHLKSIHDSSKRAAKLTRQLLLFSRKQDMEFEILDINDIVYSLNKMLNRLIGEDISMHLDLDNDLWQISADENQLEQVITNLAVNARDAMPDGGELTIGTHNIMIDEKKAQTIPDIKPGKYIQINVEDTGTGIEKGILKKIFDPFFTTKGRAEGTGMGLSVVHGIVKEHGGIIKVYSEAGEGTVFKIYLPAVEEQKSKSQIARDTEKIDQYIGTGETILIVEDEEPVLKYLEKILATYDYNSISAKSGEEAIELFEENRDDIDLLISDVIMTGMDGVELADQLKSERENLGVILSSGYSDKKVSKDIIKDKDYKFIQKPYDILKLLKLIKKSINNK